MDKKLASIFNYFAIFDYFPTFEDVYTFYPLKISKKRLKKMYEAEKYTVGEYSKKISNIKYQISKKKLSALRFRIYIKLLSLFPQIKLIGLSGSISMMNAKKDDDIDLFIITAKKRLFTGRFLALAIAFIIGLKRKVGQKKAPNKICLNLFFDELDLKIPKQKKTLFVAHEVLQMKPIINKDYTYEKFLYVNRWVLSFFPNASQIFNFQFSVFNEKFNFQFSIFSDRIENFLKNLQLKLINRHKTTEIITSTQLWFHPDDFEKKIKLK